MVWTKERGGEIHKWKNDFGHLEVSLLHGPKKEDRTEDFSDLYVINFEGLAWLITSGNLKWLMKNRGVDTLIIDELSKMKHTKSKRFKLLKPYLPRFAIKWGLTGSPAPNGLIDLFGQIYTVDIGKALGKFITHYRHKYFLPSGYGGYTWKLREGADKEIQKAIKHVALSTKAEDHLDLPQMITQDIYITLPKKARKQYNELEEQFITYLGEEAVTAANAAVASGKCRQVASGGIYANPEEVINLPTTPTFKRRVLPIHDEKTKALVELVDELQGSPLLVAYEFKHDLTRIKAALGDVPAINGQTKDSVAVEIVRAWNAGELPVLCGHPAAMAHGLNLQESGHHICWYSPTWNFEYYDQTNRRIYRQGSKAKRVFVLRLLARDTLDETIAEVLGKKQRSQNSLMKALKKLPRKRVE